MAGLVPAISLRDAQCSPNRDHRDKPGDDKLSLPRSRAIYFTIQFSKARFRYASARAKPTLRRPYSLPAPGRPSPVSSRPTSKDRGRAERLDPGGPADLDASRHRGLSKSS